MKFTGADININAAARNPKSKIQNPHSPSPWLLGLTSVVGAVAFLYPFFVPPPAAGEEAAHGADAPLIMVLLVGLCLLVLLADLETHRLDARQVALLGMLVATNALARPLPGPSGFSALFVLPILGGYVFGGGFGFLLGALSLLVSAFLTAGVGPWLPFEMYALGWAGLSAAWLPQALARRHPGGERALLAGWGCLVGVLYGALTNLWFWPFATGAGDPTAFDPATGPGGTLLHYLAFYVATSLPTDLVRGLGNGLLLALLAAPLLKLFRRFHERFTFIVTSGQ
jgi:energy-coupling factor transport system substrate-specific component